MAPMAIENLQTTQARANRALQCTVDYALEQGLPRWCVSEATENASIIGSRIRYIEREVERMIERRRHASR